MASNPLALLGVCAALLVAGCSVRTNIGDLPPQSADTDAVGTPSTTVGPESSDTEPTTTLSDESTSTGIVTVSTSAGPSSSGSDDTGALQPQMSQLAIRFGDIPEIGGSGTGTAQSSSDAAGSGGGIDDDALYVAVGVYTGTCGDPYGDGACDAWRVDFALDLDQQQPGTYDLALINGGFYEGLEFDGEDCGRGNGSIEGAVVIDSVEGGTVQGELQVLDFAPFGTDLTSFSFTAQRCE